MTKIKELIQKIESSNVSEHGNSLDLIGEVLNELKRLDDAIDLTHSKHELFLYRYYKATNTGDAEDYFSAVTVAKSFQYTLNQIGIIPNLDDEIQSEVNIEFQY